MLDDIRKTASEPENKPEAPQPKPFIEEGEKKFLGMTAKQRFVLSLLILIMTCLLGSLCLLLFGKLTF